MEIVNKHSDKLKKNFEENKKLIEELTDIKSKTIRNRVAGLLVLLNNNLFRNHLIFSFSENIKAIVVPNPFVFINIGIFFT